MAEDYYEGTEGSSGTATDKGMEGGERSEGSDTGMGETTLMPKSMFGDKDLTPGNECTIKIVKVHGDEVEVAYVPHGEEKEEKAEGESPEEAFNANFGGGGE